MKPSLEAEICSIVSATIGSPIELHYEKLDKLATKNISEFTPAEASSLTMLRAELKAFSYNSSKVNKENVQAKLEELLKRSRFAQSQTSSE